jgi:hypothetical protein
MTTETRVSATVAREDDGRHTLTLNIEGRRRFSVRYTTAEGPIADGADTAIAATLLPAMRSGGRLRIEQPVSARLLANLPRIQEMFLANSTRFRPLEVVAETRDPPSRPSDGGVACFFSGGVDSTYSVLSHRDEITHLIFVHGFDVPLSDRRLRALVTDGIHRAAAEFGLPLIEVETDLRSFSDRFVAWDTEYFGAALASVALFLAPRFRKIYIASSFAPGHVDFSASMPELDPLWQNESIELVQDTQVKRLEKVALITASSAGTDWLRVCWENRRSHYNCGRCRKCLGVQLLLRLCGSLDGYKVFPGGFDLERLSRLPLTYSYLDPFMYDYLEAAEAVGDHEVAEAIRKTLKRATPWQRRIDRIREQARASIRYRLPALRRFV